MKHIISTLILLAGAFAFANPTQTQITELNQIAESSNIIIDDSVAEKAKPFVELIQSDLSSYVELAKAKANNFGKWSFVVGSTAKKLGIELSEDADFIISGGGRYHHRANTDKAFYESFKDAGFKIEAGYRMAEYRIAMLTLGTYSDPETALKELSDSCLCENFTKLLKAVRKAQLGSEKTYKILNAISVRFAQYKDSKKFVKENWESLQADKNEAFMAYYADQKLQNLNN